MSGAAGRPLQTHYLPLKLLLAALAVFFSFPSAEANSHCIREALVYSLPAWKNPKLKVIEDLRDYNTTIGKPLRRMSLDDLQIEYARAMGRLDQMVPQFPIEDFLIWADSNRPTLVEFKALQKDGRTVGDILNAQAKKYESLFGETLPIQSVLDDAKTKVVQLIDSCGANQKCLEEGLRSYLTPIWSHTCLAGNEIAQRAIFVGLAIMASGMTVNAVREKQAVLDMPWEYFANAILWSAPLMEIACRNTERAQDAIGKEMNLRKPKTFVGRTQARMAGYFKTAPKSYMNYMIAAPLNEVTYMALHTAFEKIRGNEIDSGQTIPKFLTYVGWDAIAAVPLSVLVVDPIFMTLMPGLKEQSRKLVDSKVFSEVVYNATDITSRIEISSKRTKLFQDFEKKFVPAPKEKTAE